MQISVVSAVLLIVGLAVAQHLKTYTPVEWEHGWKTDRVVATRYQNKMMGYNIGFDFPKNPADCDREELSAFIEKHGGHIYEMGGYPGAIVYATFDGVKDRESADKKLKEILPDLSKLMASF